MKALIFSFFLFPYVAWGFDFYVEALSDYRFDKTSFQTFRKENGAKVKEDVRFDQVRIWELGGRAHVKLRKLFALIEAKYGWIDGEKFSCVSKVDGSAVEPITLKGDHGNGNTYDFTGALGCQFSLCSRRLSLAPMVGFSSYHNSYPSFNGVVTPSPDDTTVDRFTANYRNQFSGAWGGFDLYYFITCTSRVYATFRYEWLRYSADSSKAVVYHIGNQGLRLAEFQQFSYKDNVHGPFFRIGADWFFSSCFFLGALFECRYFLGSKGSGSSTLTQVVALNSQNLDRMVSISSVDVKKLKWQTCLLEVHLGFAF